MVIEKRCGRCKEIKSVDMFYLNCGSKDGHHCWCKECIKKNNKKKYDPEYYREYYLENQERIDKYQDAHYKRNIERIKKRCSEYNHKNKEKLRLNHKDWCDRNPEAVAAHNIVNIEIRNGRLIRQPCEFCGGTNFTNKTTEFHHHPNFYHEPLKGLWLCRSHHRKYHRRLEVGLDFELVDKIDKIFFEKYKLTK
jgi:hypothetical protein